MGWGFFFFFFFFFFFYSFYIICIFKYYVLKTRVKHPKIIRLAPTNFVLIFFR
jgi:hypothetical protein